VVQPVPDDMRLEIFIGMEIRIVNTKVLSLFPDQTFGNRLRKIIQDSNWEEIQNDLERDIWTET